MSRRRRPSGPKRWNSWKKNAAGGFTYVGPETSPSSSSSRVEKDSHHHRRRQVQDRSIDKYVERQEQARRKAALHRGEDPGPPLRSRRPMTRQEQLEQERKDYGVRKKWHDKRAFTGAATPMRRRHGLPLKTVDALRHRLRAHAYQIQGPDFAKEFRAMDKDHSGTLSSEELVRACRKLLPLSIDDVHVLRKVMDVDRDGLVELDEFLTFVGGGESQSPPQEKDHRPTTPKRAVQHTHRRTRNNMQLPKHDSDSADEEESERHAQSSPHNDSSHDRRRGGAAASRRRGDRDQIIRDRERARAAKARERAAATRGLDTFPFEGVVARPRDVPMDAYHSADRREHASEEPQHLEEEVVRLSPVLQKQRSRRNFRSSLDPVEIQNLLEKRAGLGAAAYEQAQGNAHNDEDAILNPVPTLDQTASDLVAGGTHVHISRRGSIDIEAATQKMKDRQVDMSPSTPLGGPGPRNGQGSPDAAPRRNGSTNKQAVAFTVSMDAAADDDDARATRPDSGEDMRGKSTQGQGDVAGAEAEAEAEAKDYPRRTRRRMRTSLVQNPRAPIAAGMAAALGMTFDGAAPAQPVARPSKRATSNAPRPRALPTRVKPRKAQTASPHQNELSVYDVYTAPLDQDELWGDSEPEGVLVAGGTRGGTKSTTSPSSSRPGQAQVGNGRSPADGERKVGWRDYQAGRGKGSSSKKPVVRGDDGEVFTSMEQLQKETSMKLARMQLELDEAKDAAASPAVPAQRRRVPSSTPTLDETLTSLVAEEQEQADRRGMSKARPGKSQTFLGAPLSATLNRHSLLEGPNGASTASSSLKAAGGERSGDVGNGAEQGKGWIVPQEPPGVLGQDDDGDAGGGEAARFFDYGGAATGTATSSKDQDSPQRRFRDRLVVSSTMLTDDLGEMPVDNGHGLGLGHGRGYGAKDHHAIELGEEHRHPAWRPTHAQGTGSSATAKGRTKTATKTTTTKKKKKKPWKTTKQTRDEAIAAAIAATRAEEMDRSEARRRKDRETWEARSKAKLSSLKRSHADSLRNVHASKDADLAAAMAAHEAKEAELERRVSDLEKQLSHRKRAIARKGAAIEEEADARRAAARAHAKEKRAFEDEMQRAAEAADAAHGRTKQQHEEEIKRLHAAIAASAREVEHEVALAKAEAERSKALALSEAANDYYKMLDEERRKNLAMVQTVREEAMREAHARGEMDAARLRESENRFKTAQEAALGAVLQTRSELATALEKQDAASAESLRRAVENVEARAQAQSDFAAKAAEQQLKAALAVQEASAQASAKAAVEAARVKAEAEKMAAVARTKEEVRAEEKRKHAELRRQMEEVANDFAAERREAKHDREQLEAELAEARRGQKDAERDVEHHVSHHEATAEDLRRSLRRALADCDGARQKGEEERAQHAEEVARIQKAADADVAAAKAAGAAEKERLGAELRNAERSVVEERNAADDARFAAAKEQSELQARLAGQAVKEKELTQRLATALHGEEERDRALAAAEDMIQGFEDEARRRKARAEESKMLRTKGTQTEEAVVLELDVERILREVAVGNDQVVNHQLAIAEARQAEALRKAKQEMEAEFLRKQQEWVDARAEAERKAREEHHREREKHMREKMRQREAHKHEMEVASEAHRQALQEAARAHREALRQTAQDHSEVIDEFQMSLQLEQGNQVALERQVQELVSQLARFQQKPSTISGSQRQRQTTSPPRRGRDGRDRGAPRVRNAEYNVQQRTNV